MALDEVISLTTVGIDIGSSTSQLSFSRLELQNVDSRYVVRSREVIHDSEIILTPFTDESTIDTPRLRSFLDKEYLAARMTNEQIDSGALILTGLALAKHNARNIADLFAADVGKFVAVSAGDAMESMLACRGAGIDKVSRERQASIVHIDMGGGTVKFAHVEGGELLALAAIDIGARLIVVDDDQTVVRIEPPAQLMLETLGLSLALGDRLTEEVIDVLSTYEASQVLAHAGLLPSFSADPRLLRTQPLFPTDAPKIDLAAFSGGVSEYIFDREQRSFGDFGRPLAMALRRLLDENGISYIEPPRGIRATVIGASQYSLQLSGSTVWASSEDLLPIRNVPVVKPSINLEPDDLDYEIIKTAVSRSLIDREPAVQTDAVAIALSWRGSALFDRIDALARALAEAEGPWKEDKDVPLIIICDLDIGGLLGRHIQKITDDKIPVLCIDGVEVSDLDFLDLGSFLPGTGALPVVVKSLLFPTAEARVGSGTTADS